MKKIKLDNLAKFFDTTRQTVARWKKEDNKLALDFAHKYLDDELLEEFFQKGEISKFEDRKFEEFTEVQGILLQTISRRILDYYRNISTLSVKVIFNAFLEETKYKMPLPEFNKYFSNIDFVKDHFYNEFTLFLHKSKDKYTIKERREAQDFMNIILRQDEIHMYYCLSYIELIRVNELDKFDREVDQLGLLRAVINKFFKKEK